MSWLSEFAAAFEREPHSVFGGATENGLGANLWSEASHQLVEYVVEYFCERGTPFFPSNNIALARASFEQIGGFDVTFPLAAGEDREFCARCQAAGFTLAAVPHAVLEHYHALSLRSFVRQHMNYGRGAFLFHLREAERKKSGVHVEPMKFYVNLVRRPFGPEGADRRRIRLAALLVLSQIANAAGFFAERFKIRRTATCW